jgi:hypothetical protein
MNRYQFTLKMLFVGLTILCIVFAYPKLTASALVIGTWLAPFAIVVALFLFALASR